MAALPSALLAACLAVGPGGEAGVKEFGPLKLGGKSLIKPGDNTEHPYKITPRANFYVYVVAKSVPPMCAYHDCGIEGIIVKYVGGWITGGAQADDAYDVGLDDVEVANGKYAMTVIADKTLKIVGIYPGCNMRSLPRVLERHHDLFIEPPIERPLKTEKK